MLCAARAALRPGAPVFRGLATSRMAAPVKPKKESKFKQMAGNIGQVAWATLAALMGFQTYMTTVSCLSCWSEGDKEACACVCMCVFARESGVNARIVYVRL